MKKYITVKEAAKLLRVNVNAIYKLRDCGCIPFIKLGVWKVAEEDLQKFLDENAGIDLLKISNNKDA